MLSVVVCAGILFAGTHATRGQTSSGTTGSSSTWRAGTAGASAAQPKLSGSSSSWTAGRGSIPTGNQSGGIWRDGSSMQTTGMAPAGAKAQPAGLAGLNTIRGFGGTPNLAGTHSPRPSTVSHTAMGPHTGIRKTSGAGIRAAARRGSMGSRTSSGSSSSSSGLASPLQHDSGLKSLAPPSLH